LSKERAEGVASVGEPPFLFAGNLGKGQIEGRDEKEWVVAEAVGASRRVEELAVDGAFRSEEDFAVAGERKIADEAGGAVGFVLHEVEKEGVVAGVGGGPKYKGLSTALRFGRDDGIIRMIEEVVVGEAGASDAGLVVQGGDFEAGVVGEDQ
jgi:hypothetical protein